MGEHLLTAFPRSTKPVALLEKEINEIHLARLLEKYMLGLSNHRALFAPANVWGAVIVLRFQ